MATDLNQGVEETKKKKNVIRHLIYILIVLIATGVSLGITLGNDFDNVVHAFRDADWRFFALMVGLVFVSYAIEGLVLVIFCRLYTRRYKFHQGFCNSLIGQFYSSVTPGASGGQPMQIYTLKSQGMQVSNAASIMVMSFILYQTSLILFDVVALIVEWNVVINITATIEGVGWTFPMWPLIIVGFILNLSLIFLFLVMSYSHRVHNFILHYVVGFLGKIRLLKNPDATRESLRVQVENFKIELKRLASNVPVIIVQIVLNLCILFARYSIPYFSAFAVHATGPMFENGFDFMSLLHVCFRTSFHQMVTGLIPLPGSAGVSDLFYSYLFSADFAGDGVLGSSQILWRTATFHVVTLVSGFVAAFYRSRGGASIQYANRKTFVTLQLETFDERKRTADTLYETRQLSRKAIQRRMNELPDLPRDDDEPFPPAPTPNKKPAKPKKAKPRKPKKTKDSSWEEWEI